MKVDWLKQAGAESVSLAALPALQAPLQRPAASITAAFTQKLSEALMRTPQCRAFDELIALGFWLRKSNLQAYMQDIDGMAKPLGLVVHYTPANVDTMFMYSWVCSLLAGNSNIVRISTKGSALQSTLLDTLLRILNEPEFSALEQANQFIQFDHQQVSGEALSLCADARILWGGDASVNRIRALPVKPRCRDISFADRHSVCAINGDAVTAADDTTLKRLAEGLWRDINPFLQQACSSPRALVWLGSQADKQRFFCLLAQWQGTQPVLENLRNEQLAFGQWLVATGQASALQQYGRLCIPEMAAGQPLVAPEHPGQWILPVHSLPGLPDLSRLITAKLQTLSYWGLEKETLVKFLAEPSITGVDRAVPVGQALDFSPFWDGYDLIAELTRQVRVH